MTSGMPSLLDSIFGKQSLEDISVEEIYSVLTEFPSFNAAHFLLSRKLKLENDPAFPQETMKTALYFNNPVWLQSLLEEDQEQNTLTKAVPVDWAPQQEEAKVPITEAYEEDPSTGTDQYPEFEEESEVPPAPFPEESREQTETTNSAGEQSHPSLTINPEEEAEYDHIKVSEAYDAAEIPEPVVNQESETEPEVTVNEEYAREEAPIPTINDEYKEEAVSPTSTINPEDPQPIINEEHARKDAPIPTINDEYKEEAVSPASTINHHPSSINPKEPRSAVSSQPSTPPFDASKADSIVFAPYHMIDYFASQGIKLVLEEQPADSFGKQLKSFTDWLKVMKRLPPKTGHEKTDERETERIRHFAANSIEERDILTETMAEVLAKQGMYENAIALYQKLSLIYPPKSAYFASRIEQLKASLS